MPRQRVPIPSPLPTRPKPLRDPFAAVAELTQEILQRQRAANRVSVETRAEQGRLLLKARQTLPPKTWTSYLASKLPFSQSTAKRAIELHHFRKRNPHLFEALCTVRLSMAEMLIQRSGDDLEAFLRQAHHVPSVGAIKTPSAMSVAEALEVLDGERPPEDRARLALERSVRASRRAIAELGALVDHREAIDRDEVAKVYDELVEALANVGQAFGLEA